MKQYRIRCIATGEWISLCSGKSSWNTSGAAKGAYATSGTYFRDEGLVRNMWGYTKGKFDDQNVLEIVEFTLCEAGVLEEAQALLKRAALTKGLPEQDFRLYSDIMYFLKENK